MDKIKAIIFDVDGVLNKDTGELFSIKFANKNKVDIELINEFFENKFRECSIGKTDLKDELEYILPKWNWHKGVDKFLKYWFESESNIDKRLLEYAISLKRKGYKIFIATQQEKYRKNYIWNEMSMKMYFEEIYATCDIGILKKDPEFFRYIINKINYDPSEIIFWDDKREIVDSAKEVEINAFRYTDFESFKKTMEGIVN